jgi:Tfp pilus assembly protein PilP
MVRGSWLPIAGLIVPLVAVAPALSQARGGTPPDRGAVLPAGGATSASAGAAADKAKPVRSVLEPQGFTYNPEGRRDPFVSLLGRGRAVTPTAPAQRPPGLAGLTAAEVSLRGIVASRGMYVAILQGADGKAYIVRPGEKLLDGVIRTITADAIVIRQQVKDPLSLDKEREVRKMLRQTEEGR